MTKHGFITMCCLAAVALLPARADGRARYKLPWRHLGQWQQQCAQQQPAVPPLTLSDSTTLNFDSIPLQPDVAALPLVFSTLQREQPDTLPAAPAQADTLLHYDRQWLDQALAQRERSASTRYAATVRHPQLVRYNTRTLPQPPREHVVEADPARKRLAIEPIETAPVQVTEATERVRLKMRNWLHVAQASLHFTQSYISANWYQGGENNLNLLGDWRWNFSLNQKLHPKYLFDNSLHYKLGVATAQGDSLRDYMVNEDNFQFSSKFGYKAVSHWYYSATLLFKTQFFNSYTTNSRKMKAAFLSPGELNVGLGMTYTYKDKDEIKNLTVSLAPLSYNLKICRNIHDLKPTSFGIDAGHHTKHSFGSNIEAKIVWRLHPSITWSSRLYAFTNYEYVQGDWENTFDFSVTRHLSTQIYTHLRYDKSHTRDRDWRYWQFKEILSFGLIYRFATN